jgi:hypothetical protein
MFKKVLVKIKDDLELLFVLDAGVDISVNVGSGFTDSDRNDYWDNSDSVIGRTAEILCDAVEHKTLWNI